MAEIVILGMCHHQEYDLLSPSEEQYVVSAHGKRRLLRSKKEGRALIIKTLNEVRPDKIFIERGYGIFDDCGIPTDQENHDHHAYKWAQKFSTPVDYVDLDVVCEKTKLPIINTLREEAMVKQVDSSLDDENTTCLFVGKSHVKAIADSLTKAGHRISVIISNCEDNLAEFD